MDNPPPKIVQGYKFNIFYPDLIDKSSTPQYFLVGSYKKIFLINDLWLHLVPIGFKNILNGQNESKFLFLILLCSRLLFILRKNAVRTLI